MPSDTKNPFTAKTETVVVVYFQISAVQMRTRHIDAVLPQFLLPNFCSISFRGHSPAGTNGSHDAFVIAGGPVQVLLFEQALIVFDGMYIFLQEATFHSRVSVLNEYAEGPQPK